MNIKIINNITIIWIYIQLEFKMFYKLIDCLLAILCYICIVIQIAIFVMVLYSIHFTNEFVYGFGFVMALYSYVVIVLPHIDMVVNDVKENLFRKNRKMRTLHVVWIYFILSFIYSISVVALIGVSSLSLPIFNK